MSFDHVHPNYRHLFNVSDNERINFLYEPRWIGYPQANKIIDVIHEYMNRPKRPRTMGLLLVGNSNNGKTSIIDRFNDLYGQRFVDEDENPHKPVIIAEAPSRADEKELYASILEQFWPPYKNTAPLIKLRYQVVGLMRDCNVKILIIDEVHSMIIGSVTKRNQVMNGLKSLSNELEIPIVCVGTSDAFGLFNQDKQYASRFDVLSLPTWNDDKDFQRLLSDFESVIPLKNKSLLGSKKLSTKLFNASNGNLGDLHRLLIECSKEAILSGKEKIDCDLVDELGWVKKTSPTRLREIKIE